MTIQVQTLFSLQTAAQFLNAGLELAATMGLPVTTWRAGDPTRTLYHFLAESLAERDSTIAEFIKAGWLSTAEGDWLEVLAWETFGVEKTQATYAEPTITLRNDGGGYYDLDAGDLTVKSTESDVTFHSTSAGVLSAGATVTFDLVADVAGSAGSVGIDEVDALVTTLSGVVVVSSTAGLANDAQSDEELREQCRASRGALSPNGPRDAYEFVARSSALTGLTSITRAKATGNGGTGAVSVYVAGLSGAVTAEAVAAVQSAIELWAEPLTVNATVASASALAVSLTITVNKSETNALTDAQLQSAIESALVTLFAATKIGGVDGGIANSRLVSEVHGAVPGGFDSVVVGGTSITLAATQVPVLAALTLVVQ
jgi:phage-related baseplate assembly protein